MADKETLEEILATTQDSTLRDMATKQLEELAAENNEDVTSQLVGLSSLLSNVGVDAAHSTSVEDNIVASTSMNFLLGVPVW